MLASSGASVDCAGSDASYDYIFRAAQLSADHVCSSTKSRIAAKTSKECDAPCKGLSKYSCVYCDARACALAMPAPQKAAMLQAAA
jgi:hypothetical protein